jgi:phage shock protein A
MSIIPFELLGQYDPAKELIDRILSKWEKDAPLHGEMTNLHSQNVQLLSQMQKLEETMRQRRTLKDVSIVKTQIAALRARVDANNAKVKENIHTILGSR